MNDFVPSTVQVLHAFRGSRPRLQDEGFSDWARRTEKEFHDWLWRVKEADRALMVRLAEAQDGPRRPAQRRPLNPVEVVLDHGTQRHGA